MLILVYIADAATTPTSIIKITGVIKDQMKFVS